MRIASCPKHMGLALNTWAERGPQPPPGGPPRLADMGGSGPRAMVDAPGWTIPPTATASALRLPTPFPSGNSPWLRSD
jgi:hypothetical protein